MLGFIAAAALPSRVSASPGDGVRAGGFVMHPSIGTEGGYETNVLLLSNPRKVDHPDDWMLRLVPQIAGERVGGRARITFVALYDWRKFAYHPTLDARNNVELGASTTIDDDRPLGFAAEERFRVQSRPGEQEVLGQYERTSNTARFSTAYRPGPALEVRPSAFWLYDRFTEGRRDLAERHNTGVQVDARWAFLSRTVFVVDGNGGRVSYTESIDIPAPVGKQVNSGSSYWQVETGVVGQVFPKINMAIKGGYGQARYARNESLSDARGFTATVKGEWTPRVTNAIGAGYERTFQDVFFTNFAVIDRVFAKYRQQVAGVWQFDGGATGEWQSYSRPFARRDFVLRIQPQVKRRLREWADVGFGYSFEQRWSHEYAPPVPGSFDPPSDYRTQGFLANATFQW